MRTHSQRLLSMVLALSMLLTFLPLSAFADDTPLPYEGSQTLDSNDPSNTYIDLANGNTYTYSLSGTTATLTKFTGEHAYVPKTVTKGTETYKVTAIGKEAFANSDNTHTPNTTLKNVDLPDSIQTIEDSAFQGCTSLYEITLWKGLTTIEHGAFAYCSNLSKIVLPEGLTTVGNAAFAMASLTDVTLPKSLKKVGETAFTSAINTVTYTGTKTDWDNLVNSASFDKSNTPLTSPHNFYYAHTVTFNKNGHGDSEEKVVEYNHTTTPISKPTADGFTFKYWFTTSENGEEKEFNFNTEIIEDTELFAHWEEKTTPEKPSQPTTPEQPGTNPTQQNPDKPTPPQNPDDNKPGTPEKPNEPTPPEAPAVEEDDTAAIGYAAAAVTAAFVGWGAYRIGSEVYLKYLLPNDVLLPQNRIQLAKLLWEDAGRPAPADAAAYTDVDANDADAQQAARWAVENGLLTLPDTEKPEEFAPYRSVSYAKSARAWNQAQQLKENAAAR